MLLWSPTHFSEYLYWFPSVRIFDCEVLLSHISRCLLDMTSSMNEIACMGSIHAFIKSSTVKNEILRHRQKLQDWKNDFTVRIVAHGDKG